MAEEQGPIALDVQQQFRSLDPATRELFYGSGIPGTDSYSPGFLQQAFQASNRSFFDEQGNPIVAPQQVAGLSPDQQRAIQLSRQATGVQTPYLEEAGGSYRAGLQDLFRGTDTARGLGREALGSVAGGVGQEQAFREQGLESLFGGLGEAAGIARGAERQFGRGLGEASDFLRQGGTGRFNQAMTQDFYDPYEQAVVDQTTKDIMKAGAKSDIAARASDIGRGGESAFGSRARLGATERQEALGRGLGEAIGGIRSRGYQQAQQSALGEFGRQQQALTGLGGSLANVAGQRAAGMRGLGSTLAGYGQAGQQALSQAGQSALAGQQTLANQLSQLGGTEAQIGQQRQQAQFGAGSAMSGLGQQAQQAAQADIQRTLGIGGMTQGQQQAQLDAARANAMQYQMAPMQQMQSLLPFVQSVPAGFSQTATTYGLPPSALQTGLGAGLSALGGLGSFFNPPQTNYYAQPTGT
jgi:hypothetical protein